VSLSRRFALLAALFASPPQSRADELPFPIGPASFDVTSGTPVSVTSGSQAALNNVLGYTMTTNWTAGAGNPRSIELVLGVTAPGGTGGILLPIGGVANSNPYTFPGNVNSAGVFTLLNTGTLPNFTAGTYTAEFRNLFSSSTMNLANTSLTIFSNPTMLSGTTAGGPTFDRPAVGDFGGGATGVAYATNRVVVSTTGRYMFAEGYTGAGYDGVLYLYQGSFDPLNPTANLIGAADNPDFSNVPSSLTAPLTAGTEYVLVSTGFTNTDFGTFDLYGAGPGAVTFNPVPEPGTTLLAAVSALGAGAWLRRRRATTA
jgi:hypothetical protein